MGLVCRLDSLGVDLVYRRGSLDAIPAFQQDSWGVEWEDLLDSLGVREACRNVGCHCSFLQETWDGSGKWEFQGLALDGSAEGYWHHYHEHTDSNGPAWVLMVWQPDKFVGQRLAEIDRA